MHRGTRHASHPGRHQHGGGGARRRPQRRRGRPRRSGIRRQLRRHDRRRGGRYVFAGGIPEDYTGGSIQASISKPARSRPSTPSATASQLRGPNDIVFDAHGGFYFTDHGKSDGRGDDKGRLFYGRPTVRRSALVAET